MNSSENLGAIAVSISKISYDFIIDNIFMMLSGLVIYFLISIFILKPYVQKKAANGIGGNLVIKFDPLLIILPVLFSLVFSASWLILIITKS